MRRRYAADRAVRDAVAAVGRSVRTARGLAALWSRESLTIGRRGGVERLPEDHPWMREARAFLDWCTAERVEPARYVAALFDFARVSRARAGRRGARAWVPALRAARSAFSRTVYAEWEARQRAAADRQPSAEIAGARRLAAAQWAPAAEPERRVAVRRRRHDLSAGAVIERDALAYARLAAPRLGMDPALVVEVDPYKFSPMFRRLAGCQLAGDTDDPLASALDDAVLAERVKDAYAARGVPRALFL